MTTRDKPVSGELKLKDYWNESTSTHIEKSHSLILVSGGHAGVQLIEQKESSNAYRPYEDSESRECWTIPVDALVALIKSHGTKA
jgi:hypothetical protein